MAASFLIVWDLGSGQTGWWSLRDHMSMSWHTAEIKHPAMVQPTRFHCFRSMITMCCFGCKYARDTVRGLWNALLICHSEIYQVGSSKRVAPQLVPSCVITDIFPIQEGMESRWSRCMFLHFPSGFCIKESTSSFNSWSSGQRSQQLPVKLHKVVRTVLYADIKVPICIAWLGQKLHHEHRSIYTWQGYLYDMRARRL